MFNATEQRDPNGSISGTKIVNEDSNKPGEQAAVPKKEEVKGELTLDLGGGVKMEFVRIPKGTFLMGSPPDEKDGLENEQQHEVELTHDFYLGKYHVTREQFSAFVADSAYQTDAENGKGGNVLDVEAKNGKWVIRRDANWINPVNFQQSDKHPVVMVSWNDATEFCAWATKKTGRAVRLPSEAEWEYACRAGSRTRFFFGDEAKNFPRFANFADASLSKVTGVDWRVKESDGYAFTSPVGNFKPNARGLYDMHGNVWQWCQDWYGKEYYGNSPKRDPQGPERGLYRVFRGGSWAASPWQGRAAYRWWRLPSNCGAGNGFRVAIRLD
jgi:formylglycine-generating enzyme required for sulfatase activity